MGNFQIRFYLPTNSYTSIATTLGAFVGEGCVCPTDAHHQRERGSGLERNTLNTILVGLLTPSGKFGSFCFTK